MAWTDIEPNKKNPALTDKAPLLIGISVRGKVAQRILVTVRTGMFSPPLPFWKNGAKVGVQIGSGNDAGKIRIVPNGPHQIRFMGPHAEKAGAVTLQFPLPQSIPSSGEPSSEPEFDYTDDWLEITLPAWRPGNAAAAPAVTKPAPVVTQHGGPFRTVATVGKGPQPVNGGR